MEGVSERDWKERGRSGMGSSERAGQSGSSEETRRGMEMEQEWKRNGTGNAIK